MLGRSNSLQTELVTEYEAPKVALMFLSVRELHNEPVWRAFFEAASRLSLLHEPASSPKSSNSTRKIQQALFSMTSAERKEMVRLDESKRDDRPLECKEEQTLIEQEAVRLMSRDWNATDLIDKQSLFSVYVNCPAYSSSEERSIFTDRVIEDLVDTTEGFAQFSLVAAALKMIEHALRDPNNQKFVLLSESCIPIQPPEVIHAQLISENHSRINACLRRKLFISRWRPKIVKKRYWRKSSQFFALSRRHAQLAADDTELKSTFSQYCNTNRGRICVPDEHYFPTLLAFHGMENQTDCEGQVTSIKWNGLGNSWHPITYKAKRINAAFLRSLADHDKKGEECDIDDARATTAAVYEGFSSTGCVTRDFNSTQLSSASHWMVEQGYRPLPYSCSMFARKFPPTAVQETLEAALSCTATGLGYWCY